MRLRTHTFTRTPEPLQPQKDPGLIEDSDLSSVTRRLPVDEAPDSVHAAECSAGDIGRVVMDWLSWSVQVGHTPDRIVCIGPATIPQRPAPGEPAPTPASIAQALGASWPGSTIDAAIHEDPIGATLNRLRAQPMFAPAKAGPDATRLEEDPRLNVVSLTTRAGRLDRTMYIWTTVAILAAAAAVFIYARRLGAGTEELRTRLAAVQNERTKLLQSAEHIIPVLSKSPDPIGMLSAKIQEYSDEMARVKRSTRYLPQLLPALRILDDDAFADLQITAIGAGEVRVYIDFTVPAADSSPETIVARLNERYGAGVWSGQWGATRSDRRTYTISSNSLGESAGTGGVVK
jgi:hypothetical protein